MVLSLRVSYWLTLALAIPAAGFMMRSFIIFHDCCHGSFFKSQKANDIVGIITGVLTFTPYYFWRHSHALHHATAGDLDRRGVGDVWTMTVDEYLACAALAAGGLPVHALPAGDLRAGAVVRCSCSLSACPPGPVDAVSAWASG